MLIFVQSDGVLFVHHLLYTDAMKKKTAQRPSDEEDDGSFRV